MIVRKTPPNSNVIPCDLAVSGKAGCQARVVPETGVQVRQGGGWPGSGGSGRWCWLFELLKRSFMSIAITWGDQRKTVHYLPYLKLCFEY